MQANTVLCIDDLVQQLTIRRAILAGKGYFVQTACSANEDLKTIREAAVDIVLLEYKHEGMDAGAIAFLIKQRFPELPIILMSAFSEIPEEILWLFDDYVWKGATTEELAHMIEAHVSKKQLRQTAQAA
jgi:DNA-binding NtrC family response regulator